MLYQNAAIVIVFHWTVRMVSLRAYSYDECLKWRVANTNQAFVLRVKDQGWSLTAADSPTMIRVMPRRNIMPDYLE